MSKISSIEQFEETISTAKGNSLDVYETLYQMCAASEDHIDLFLKSLFEAQHPIGTDDGAPSSMTQDEAEEIRELYRVLLIKKTRDLVQKNDPETVFYQNLWKSIFRSATAPDSDAKRAVCLKILNEEVPVLPYYQQKDLVRMTDEEYSERMHNLAPTIREMVFIINRNFAQKTEETSQLYRLMEGLSREDASVYLASLLTYYRKVYLSEGYRLARKESEPPRPSDSTT